MTAIPAPRSVLSTRRGVLTLLLLCAVQFMDIIDSSIMNVALPSIRADLGFSPQRLQWVLSGYLVTYGGLLVLGGRAADLLGRRRVLSPVPSYSPRARWPAGSPPPRPRWWPPGSPRAPARR